ncbi:MAG: MATE family efflux transporter [Bacillota bacterium]
MGNKRNLLQGNTVINLLAVSVPTMMGFAFQMVYDLVDLMWIGRISSQAIAGVTIFTTIFWMVEVLNGIIGMSSVSLISQNFGKGDMDRTAAAIEQTFTFKALVAIIAGALMLVILKPLLNFFTKDPQVLKAALDYGYIRTFFLPVMFSSYTINTAFRCIGDAKKPMIIMLISSVLNCILDPIFMFDTIPGTSLPGFNMGVFGAALATVISITVAFIIAFIILMKNDKVKINMKRSFKLDWEMDKKLITIGLPSGIETLSRNLVGIFTLKFVAVYGTAAVAAMGIGNRLFGFAFMVLIGLSMGGSSITGQCIGANDVHRAKVTAREAAIIGTGFMAVFAVLAIIFPKAILGIFVSEPDVILIGISMLKLGTFGLVFAGITIGLGCVFSGAGYNIPYLVSSVVGRWCVQIPLLFVVVTLLHLPIIWVWLVFLAAEIAEMLVIVIAYKKGTWATYKVC